MGRVACVRLRYPRVAPRRAAVARSVQRAASNTRALAPALRVCAPSRRLPASGPVRETCAAGGVRGGPWWSGDASITTGLATTCATRRSRAHPPSLHCLRARCGQPANLPSEPAQRTCRALTLRDCVLACPHPLCAADVLLRWALRSWPVVVCADWDQRAHTRPLCHLAWPGGSRRGARVCGRLGAARFRHLAACVQPGFPLADGLLRPGHYTARCSAAAGRVS